MDKWIPLMVRIEDYAEFCSEVESRERERGEQSGPRQQIVATVSSDKCEKGLAKLQSWSVEDLRVIIEMADRFKTMDCWMRAMDVVSQHPGPGSFRSTSDVAEAAGMEVTKWRDAQRKINTDAVKKHFANDVGAPLRGEWGPDLGIDDKQFYWGITEEQADRWRQARGEVSR